MVWGVLGGPLGVLGGLGSVLGGRGSSFTVFGSCNCLLVPEVNLLLVYEMLTCLIVGDWLGDLLNRMRFCFS